MDQDATWYAGAKETLLDADPASLSKRGTAAPPNFSARIYYGQTVAHLSCCELLLNLTVKTALKSVNF